MSETATDPNRMNPYGPGANADETRQAQHMAANDTPVDVNMNAVIARKQAQTTAHFGDEMAAASARRTIFADRDLNKP